MLTRTFSFVSILGLFLAFYLLAGCSGGQDIEESLVIDVASAVNENSAAIFKIASQRQLTCDWDCTPRTVGWFDRPNSRETTFFSAPVTGDTTAAISVSITSPGHDPVVRSIDITIRDNGPSGWLRAWGGKFNDAGWALVFDRDENLYITGWFEGSFPMGPSGPDTQDYGGTFLGKFDKEGNFLWGRAWGSESDMYSEYRGGVDVDSQGNIYVGGWYTGTVDFDPGPGITRRSMYGIRDVFVSKFDPDGNFQWVRTWGGTGYDECRGIRVDGSGNLWVIGDFENTVELSDGDGIRVVTSAGKADIYLSRFDLSGNYIGSYIFGGPGFDFGHSVDTDALDNICITGGFGGNTGGSVDFDPGDGEYLLTSNGDRDVYIVKLDQSGELIWAESWGSSTGPDSTCGFHVEPNGDIYAAGWFEDRVDFDPGPGEDWHMSHGSVDISLSRFDPDGNLIWARTMGGVHDLDKGCGVAVDQSGNIFITGRFWGTVDFDPGPGEDWHTSAKWVDAYLAKFDSQGNHLWAHSWGQGWDFGKGIAVDSSGCVYLTGGYEGMIDFNFGAGVAFGRSHGTSDGYLVKYLPDGSI